MRNIKGTICAVGGGKGGVGKSLVALNTACALALDRPDGSEPDQPTSDRSEEC